MLAGRLVKMARDILSEYSKSNVIDLLNEARSVSASRSPTPQSNAEYNQRSAILRTRANSILENNFRDLYPSSLRDYLYESGYATALPERLAKIILSGFPDDIRLAMSANEIDLYIQSANSLFLELLALDRAGSQFRIENVVIPDGLVGLDILIPRTSFHNRTDEFFSLMSKTSNVFSYFIELATGSEGCPELTYTSTSDPVIGIAMVGAAVGGILKLYKLFLDCAIAHMTMLKSLKEMRNLGIDGADVYQEKIEAVIVAKISEAIRKSVDSVKTNSEIERVNEIKVAIAKNARTMVSHIINGFRIDISIESLDRLDLVAESASGESVDELKSQLIEKGQLEEKVHLASLALGQDAQALLSSQ